MKAKGILHPMTDWSWTSEDAHHAAEWHSALPARVFDAHAHIYRLADLRLGNLPQRLLAAGPATAGIATWRQAIERLIGPDRLAGGLLIPFPAPGGDYQAAHQFLLAELRSAPSCRGLLLVGPVIPRKAIEPLLAHPSIAGFKPYHLLAPAQSAFQAAISDYLPDWAWDLADRRGLAITLHMVRDLALADPVNQRQIRQYCERYPRARLILAHAARGFHAPNTVRGLAALEGLDNVWFDASSICEPTALRAIIEAFGPRRLMWGSDFPVSEQRGRCVTVANSFAWINPDRIDDYPEATPLRTWPVGLENLRALFEAADTCGLNRADLQDIFADNARRLLGLAHEPGTTTQAAYCKGRGLIPGGTNLLSKRPELFAPGQWPAYFREARGCRVWDLDGRGYTDLSLNGVGACLLGFRDPDVNRAVHRRILLGNLCTLNPVEEVELAETLCALHPWASQVRLARTGGEMASVAVRIARATTDRSAVAICGYHGWCDWYLAANLGEDDSLRGHLLPGLEPLGVPRELRGTAFTFTYNNRDQLKAIIDEHGSRLAAVIMEPCRSQDPDPGFLEYVRDAAHRVGALLIFDEISIGFRLTPGGAHLRFGVNPDMALFGKTLGNGYPIAAVIGTSEAMEGAQASFISSSYWTDGIGPAAALATLARLKEVDILGHTARIGALIQQRLREAAARHSLPITVKGYPAVPLFSFDHEQAAALKTLYTQEMLARGYLAGSMIYVTLAHTEEIIERFAVAVHEVFGILSKALAKNDVEKRLKGPIAHSGFQRLL